MADNFIKHVINNSLDAGEVHIVFDRYLANSTKTATRDKRGMNSLEYHVHAKGNVPQNWDQFLMCRENKSNLAKVYTEHICNVVAPRLEDKVIYISGGKSDTALKVTKDGVEEADGRIILHARIAADNGGTVVVATPDTDVLVLLLHHR